MIYDFFKSHHNQTRNLNKLKLGKIKIAIQVI